VFEFNFVHRTPSKDISINLKAIMLESNSLDKYEDKCKIEKLCADWCTNYGKKWSCPPFSPSYTTTSNDYSKVLLLLLYCDLMQLNYIKTEYMKVKASNSILKSRSEKLIRYIEKELGGYMLSNGSCRLCKPCTNKLGDSGCKKPTQMRYSLESLGLHVDQISEVIFNHRLLWYGNKIAPEYSTVISGLLLEASVTESEIKNMIKKIDVL